MVDVSGVGCCWAVRGAVAAAEPAHYTSAHGFGRGRRGGMGRCRCWRRLERRAPWRVVAVAGVERSGFRGADGEVPWLLGRRRGAADEAAHGARPVRHGTGGPRRTLHGQQGPGRGARGRVQRLGRRHR